jgi:hypothetical protein
MQLTDWLLVEAALLLIGLAHIALLTKTHFDPLGRDQSSFRLSSLCWLRRNGEGDSGIWWNGSVRANRERDFFLYHNYQR